MKRMILTLACLAAFVANAFAVTYSYHNAECGKMSENCDVAGGFALKVSHLIISGDVDNSDFDFIFSTFTNVDTLDVSSTNVTWNGEYNKLLNDGTIVYRGDGIGIEVFYLPDNVTEVGNLFFHQYPYFTGLKKIIVSGNPYFTSIDGILYDKSEETLIAVPASFDGIIEMPETTRTVADYAGYGAKDLREIHFNSRLSEIGNYAFACCYNLATLKNGGGVPEAEGLNVTGYIGQSAFNSCPILSDIELPDCISDIGEEAFARCQSIQSIVLPRYLKKLSGFIFTVSPANSWQGVLFPQIKEITLPKYLKTLEVVDLFRYFQPSIKLAEGCLNFTLIDGGVLYDKDKTYLYYYPKDKTGSYEILETCKTIGRAAFYKSKIENLTSSSVEKIEQEEYSDSFWSGGREPKYDIDFSECQYINKVELNSLKRFEAPKTYDFSSMKSLIIPSATEVYLMTTGDLEYLDASSAEKALLRDSKLKRVIFGNKLKTVDLDIYNSNNSNFSGIEEVYVGAVEPPDGPDLREVWNGTLFVPEGCYEKYLVAPFWSCFSTIKEYNFGGAQDAVADDVVRVVATTGGIRLEGADAATRVVVYDVSGRMVYDGTGTEIALPQGMYIVKAGNEVSKVVVR